MFPFVLGPVCCEYTLHHQTQRAKTRETEAVLKTQSFSKHLDLGQTGNNARLNATLVGASLNVEEAGIAPVLVPAVGNSPIG